MHRIERPRTAIFNRTTKLQHQKHCVAKSSDSEGVGSWREELLPELRPKPAALDSQSNAFAAWLHTNQQAVLGSRDSLLVRALDRDRKVTSSNPGRSGWRNSFSSVNFVCWLFFGVCFNPVLLQLHVKDSGHSAKSAGGRSHLNMHTPLTQRSWSGLTTPLSRHSAGTLSENELTHNLSGNTQSQSSQLAEPLWTDPGQKELN